MSYTPSPPPIVAFATDNPAMRERVARYGRDLDRLAALKSAVAFDRSQNSYRRGGLFSGPPAPIPTEAREIEVLRLTRELELEHAAIAGLVPVWDRLGGAPSTPEATNG